MPREDEAAEEETELVAVELSDVVELLFDVVELVAVFELLCGVGRRALPTINPARNKTTEVIIATTAVFWRLVIKAS